MISLQILNEEFSRKLFDNIKDLNSIITPLIILLGLNLAAFIGRFLLDLIVKNREIRINKVNIINEKKVVAQAELFKKLNLLSISQSEPINVYLDRIMQAETYLTENKIFINKDLIEITYKILDYHKIVLQNQRAINYKQELQLIDEYIKKFNK